MAKGKKKKRPQGGAKARLSVPAPMPEEENPMPSSDGASVHLITRYASRNGQGRGGAFDVTRLMDMHRRIYMQYNAALLERFEAEHGRLSKMDTIDASGCADARGDVDYTDVLSMFPNPILACTPCYERGVLRMASDVDVYFQVESLDLDARKLSLYLHAFRRQKEYRMQVEPGVSGALDVSIVPGSDGRDRMRIRNADPSRAAFFTDAYVAVSPRELGWTAEEADYWRRVVVQNASNQLQRYRNHGIDFVENVGIQFCAYIAVVNAILERSRPKLLPRDAPENDIPKPGVVAAPRAPAAPTRPYDPDEPRVRVVQGIRFTSRKPPRRAAQAVRQYKTPAWTVRGHTRTYKSGKTAYIKPGVRRRKGLADGTPQQSIIKIAGDPEGRADGNGQK